MGSEFVDILTPRLRLRAWRETDLAPFATMNADPRVMEHFPAPLDPAASDALAGRIRDHHARHGFGGCVVETREGAEFVGTVGLTHIRFDTPFTPAVEIGWRLAHAHWGKGYAAEAARAALAIGFDQLQLDQIYSFTVPANVRSWRLMERMGMTRSPADDFDHPLLPPDSPLRRHVTYVMRKDDWARLGTVREVQ